MAHVHLFRRRAEGQRQHLMAQADTENWLAGFYQALDRRHRILSRRRRVAWSVGEKDAIGVKRQDIFGGGRGRHHRDPALGRGQTA